LFRDDGKRLDRAIARVRGSRGATIGVDVRPLEFVVRKTSDPLPGAPHPLQFSLAWSFRDKEQPRVCWAKGVESNGRRWSLYPGRPYKRTFPSRIPDHAFTSDRLGSITIAYAKPTKIDGESCRTPFAVAAGLHVFTENVGDLSKIRLRRHDRSDPTDAERFTETWEWQPKSGMQICRAVFLLTDGTTRVFTDPRGGTQKFAFDRRRLIDFSDVYVTARRLR
jgi:hypothetical protein